MTIPSISPTLDDRITHREQIAAKARTARYWLRVHQDRHRDEGTALTGAVVTEQRNKVSRLDAEVSRLDEEIAKWVVR